MSPGADGQTCQAESFPRVSGDEPVANESSEEGDRFSPRERG